MASSSGVIVIVLIGALALGSSQDSGCQSTEGDPTPTDVSTDPDDDFSFEPAPRTGTDDGGPEPTDDPADDDFSFEPESP